MISTVHEMRSTLFAPEESSVSALRIWPDLHVPREEYLKDSGATHEDRFPSPTIFPVCGR